MGALEKIDKLHQVWGAENYKTTNVSVCVGFRDWVPKELQRVGCVELLNTVQKRVRPKLHAFGGIHEGTENKIQGQRTGGSELHTDIQRSSTVKHGSTVNMLSNFVLVTSQENNVSSPCDDTIEGSHLGITSVEIRSFTKKGTTHQL